MKQETLITESLLAGMPWPARERAPAAGQPFAMRHLQPRSLVRAFSIISFIAIAAAGILLGLCYRHADAIDMTAGRESAQLVVATAAILVMTLLYGSLVMATRWVGTMIDTQQRKLRERSELLAALSAEMMNSQEDEKQRIAGDLHERVAQTLAAVKLAIESAAVRVRDRDESVATTLAAMVAPLQAAIHEVRATAAGLRPASLDDLGLLATLRELCRELAGKHPKLKIEHRFHLGEDDIPAALRPIIFRAIEDACKAMTVTPAVGCLRMALDADHERITLTLHNDGQTSDDDDPGYPYAGLRDRALLTGGKFHVHCGPGGDATVMASWLR